MNARGKIHRIAGCRAQIRAVVTSGGEHKARVEQRVKRLALSSDAPEIRALSVPGYDEDVWGWADRMQAILLLVEGVVIDQHNRRLRLESQSQMDDIDGTHKPEGQTVG